MTSNSDASAAKPDASGVEPSTPDNTNATSAPKRSRAGSKGTAKAAGAKTSSNAKKSASAAQKSEPAKKTKAAGADEAEQAKEKSTSKSAPSKASATKTPAKKSTAKKPAASAASKKDADVSVKAADGSTAEVADKKSATKKSATKKSSSAKASAGKSSSKKTSTGQTAAKADSGNAEPAPASAAKTAEAANLNDAGTVADAKGAKKPAAKKTPAKKTASAKKAVSKEAASTETLQNAASPAESENNPDFKVDGSGAKVDEGAKAEASAAKKSKPAAKRGRGKSSAGKTAEAAEGSAKTESISKSASAPDADSKAAQTEALPPQDASGATTAASPAVNVDESKGESAGSAKSESAGKADTKALAASPSRLALAGQESSIALEGAEAALAIESAEAQNKNRRRSNKRPKTSTAENEDAQASAPEKASAKGKSASGGKAKAKRKMFVNVLAGEQVEVVVAEEGQLREYYVEMLHQAKIKGNIYKGVIHNVDPNLQAAFVSYGAVKNGFLQIDEVHPEYYLTPHEQGKGHKYPLIQKVLKAGQEILVQVVKEPSGTKGAFLTSYLSIPGRYLVLTPGREQVGVSRKVGSDTERGRLRDILNSLSLGEGLGVIVRTASEGASKTNLQRDLQMLKRVWREVRKKGSTEQSPALIYQELGLAARAVRDYLTDDVAELWVNDKEMADNLNEVIQMMFPKRKSIMQLHDDSSQSLFERFGLARQISQVQSREVVMPSGGRLVFDQTEALMAIDINSGRTGGKSNFEDMAFKLNMEAAQHIPLQLRLRDIGGQVVVDFIEMRDRSHWREVEKTFRNGMKEDRARHDVGKISSFGLLEVVRQRLGSSAISIASEPCPFCKGTGTRRNMEWQALQAMQDIQQLIRQNMQNGQNGQGDNNGYAPKTIVYTAEAELVLYLLNSKKEWLLDVEQENNVKLELLPGL